MHREVGWAKDLSAHLYVCLVRVPGFSGDVVVESEDCKTGSRNGHRQQIAPGVETGSVNRRV